MKTAPTALIATMDQGVHVVVPCDHRSDVRLPQSQGLRLRRRLCRPDKRPRVAERQHVCPISLARWPRRSGAHLARSTVPGKVAYQGRGACRAQCVGAARVRYSADGHLGDRPGATTDAGRLKIATWSFISTPNGFVATTAVTVTRTTGLVVADAPWAIKVSGRGLTGGPHTVLLGPDPFANPPTPPVTGTTKESCSSKGRRAP